MRLEYSRHFSDILDVAATTPLDVSLAKVHPGGQVVVVRAVADPLRFGVAAGAEPVFAESCDGGGEEALVAGPVLVVAVGSHR